MAKQSAEAAPREDIIEVTCPCCGTELWIGVKSRSIVRHKEPERRTVAGFEDAVARHKGAEGRREEAFQKSVAQHKSQADVLAKKFDELLKIAKDHPDEAPPLRDIDRD